VPVRSFKARKQLRLLRETASKFASAEEAERSAAKLKEDAAAAHTKAFDEAQALQFKYQKLHFEAEACSGNLQ